ncbi:MAG: flavin reductase family protein [Elusimicrobiota bacterium]
MLKKLPLSEFYHLINHGPCVLITSGSAQNANVAPVAWTMPVNDDPPMLAISVAESHYTAELIGKTGEFAVNIPDKKMLAVLMSAGKVSGRKENKIRKYGISIQDGIKISTPHLEDAIGCIECRVKEKRVYEGVVVIIADVLHCAVKKGLYDSYWITPKAKTLHHLGSGYFCTPGKRFKYK